MEILAGTSGFSCKEWKGPFYPDKMPEKDMLAFYATKLPAVEINNTFYRMPKRDVSGAWAGETPDHFRFAIKASRRVTHFKRLKDTDEQMANLPATQGPSRSGAKPPWMPTGNRRSFSSSMKTRLPAQSSP